MRIEIILFLATCALLFHIHTDGMYLKRILSSKKQLKMGAVILGAIFVYYMVKRNPMKAKDLVMSSNEYIKYLPIDKNTANFISPILDFTVKNTYGGNGRTLHIPSEIPAASQQRIMSSGRQSQIDDLGRKKIKRSVSETKKKFVASRQNWRCGHCDKQLTAWFEVDHKVRLEYGGSNHIDNLVALCRECHGEKTTIENL